MYLCGILYRVTRVLAIAIVSHKLPMNIIMIDGHVLLIFLLLTADSYEMGGHHPIRIMFALYVHILKFEF